MDISPVWEGLLFLVGTIIGASDVDDENWECTPIWQIKLVGGCCDLVEIRQLNLWNTINNEWVIGVDDVMHIQGWEGQEEAIEGVTIVGGWRWAIVKRSYWCKEEVIKLQVVLARSREKILSLQQRPREIHGWWWYSKEDFNPYRWTHGHKRRCTGTRKGEGAMTLRSISRVVSSDGWCWPPVCEKMARDGWSLPTDKENSLHTKRQRFGLWQFEIREVCLMKNWEWAHRHNALLASSYWLLRTASVMVLFTGYHRKRRE